MWQFLLFMTNNIRDIQSFLDKKADQYNQLSFIAEDPVAIPHQYTKLQDIEISAFFAALFAWGRRSLILKKTKSFLSLMENTPYDFILNHQEKDLKRFLPFVHRTFNATDMLYFIGFLRNYYRQHFSLESAFFMGINPGDKTIESGLDGFHRLIFPGDHPPRTEKHISMPARKSACKRLNMFLRWMVRKDSRGVDFGLWKRIRPDQLVIPMDVHVSRVSARLGLIPPGSVNWKAALALTDALRTFDPQDPVKYDFALFGLGILEHFK